MALKDTKLEEKEQLVVKGDILADGFRDRVTGQELAALSPEALEELSALLSKISIDGNIVTVHELEVGIQLYLDNGLGALRDEEDNPLLPLSEANAGKVLAVNSAGTGVEAVDPLNKQSNIVDISPSVDDIIDGEVNIVIKQGVPYKISTDNPSFSNVPIKVSALSGIVGCANLNALDGFADGIITFLSDNGQLGDVYFIVIGGIAIQFSDEV